MTELIVFTPTVVEMRKKGRMVLFYDISGTGDAEHICSFFHEHKANWAAKCMENTGVTVNRGEGLVEAKPKKSAAKSNGSNGAKKKLKRLAK